MSTSEPNDQPSLHAVGSVKEEPPSFAPTIPTEDIFRRLIAEEIRSGRLTPRRRRKIVQYAAQLQLSATQAGELIEACRQGALDSEDPVEQRCAFRLVDAPRPKIPTHLKITLVILAAIVFDLLLLKWMA